MNDFLENLRREAEQNPTVALAVAAGLLTAGAKFIDAVAHHKGSNAYAKDARRREKASQK